MKTKKASNKILPPVSIEPLAQDYKSSMLPHIQPPPFPTMPDHYKTFTKT